MNKVTLSMQLVVELGHMVPFHQVGNTKPLKTIDVTDASLSTAACAALLRGIADEMDPKVEDWPPLRAMTGTIPNG